MGQILRRAISRLNHMNEELVAYIEIVDGHFADLIYGMWRDEYGERFEKLLEFSVQLQDVLRTVKYKSGDAE